jgi:hypothetical protein
MLKVERSRSQRPDRLAGQQETQAQFRRRLKVGKISRHDGFFCRGKSDLDKWQIIGDCVEHSTLNIERPTSKSGRWILRALDSWL